VEAHVRQRYSREEEEEEEERKEEAYESVKPL